MKLRAISLCFLGLTACGEVATAELELAGVASQGISAAPACSAAKLDEVLAAATSTTPEVSLTCSLTLPAGRVITKKLVMKGAGASGVTVDCQGSSIEPTQSTGSAYSVTIRS